MKKNDCKNLCKKGTKECEILSSDLKNAAIKRQNIQQIKGDFLESLL